MSTNGYKPWPIESCDVEFDSHAQTLRWETFTASLIHQCFCDRDDPEVSELNEQTRQKHFETDSLGRPWMLSDTFLHVPGADIAIGEVLFSFPQTTDPSLVITVPRRVLLTATSESVMLERLIGPHMVNLLKSIELDTSIGLGIDIDVLHAEDEESEREFAAWKERERQYNDPRNLGELNVLARGVIPLFKQQCIRYLRGGRNGIDVAGDLEIRTPPQNWDFGR